jgi:hypothetical protein
MRPKIYRPPIEFSPHLQEPVTLFDTTVILVHEYHLTQMA